MPSKFDIDVTMIADYACHASHDSVRLDGWIASGHGVSARDERVGRYAQDAVGDDVAICAIEDNLAQAQICKLTSPHGDYIARPHSGEHAGAGEFEAHFTGVASYL